ncbi:hypothetical protein ACCD06_21740 [Azospirillum sp. CT11-132]|uniref:hypothetical protein n=1 Tax=unclassified Azospirillum TaxID=2630922 RepID=UPI0035282313
MLPSAPRLSGHPMHLLVDSTGLKLCGPGGAKRAGSCLAARAPVAAVAFSRIRRSSGMVRGLQSAVRD